MQFLSYIKPLNHFVSFLSFIYFFLRVKFSRLLKARARSLRSAHGGGAGPRGVSAARDEKLVPDIYLTIPGSSDAPRPGFSAAYKRMNMNDPQSDATEVSVNLSCVVFL